MLVKKPGDLVNEQEAKLGQEAGSSLSGKTKGSSQKYEDSCLLSQEAKFIIKKSSCLL
jgi:hypothetical protein